MGCALIRGSHRYVITSKQNMEPILFSHFLLLVAIPIPTMAISHRFLCTCGYHYVSVGMWFVHKLQIHYRYQFCEPLSILGKLL